MAGFKPLANIRSFVDAQIKHGSWKHLQGQSKGYHHSAAGTALTGTQLCCSQNCLRAHIWFRRFNTSIHHGCRAGTLVEQHLCRQLWNAKKGIFIRADPYLWHILPIKPGQHNRKWLSARFKYPKTLPESQPEGEAGLPWCKSSMSMRWL